MNKARDVRIDMIKGIAIILMVLGHCRVPFMHFIYLFHMSVFIMASGYCLKEKSSENFRAFFLFLKKRIIGIWLPYVIFNSLFTVFHNVFIKINFYSDDIRLLNYFRYFDLGATSLTNPMSFTDTVGNIGKTLLFGGATELGGAMWFLAVLFEVSILFVFIDTVLTLIAGKILKFGYKGVRIFKLIFQSTISIAFLYLGYCLSKNGLNPHLIGTDLTVYSLYFLGYLLKEFNISDREKNFSDRAGIIILSFIALLIFNRFCSIEISINVYDNPLYVLACAFLGWEFLYELSQLISRTFLMRPLLVIGQNTLFVLALHFFVFKLVNLLLVLINKLPIFLTAVFPILYSGGAYCILYSSLGVAIPVFLSILWKKIKSSLVIRRKTLD